MDLVALMTIACFISPNPSPWNLMVSGPPADVAALDSAVRSTPGVSSVAQASDGPIAFARYDISGEVKYGAFIGVLNRVQQSELMMTFTQSVQSCADGRQDDVGNPHAPPVAVGVIAPDGALADIKAGLGWTKIEPIRLADGRQGIGFRPDPDHADKYGLFAVKAARGEWPKAQIILVRPARNEGS
jgi:hypothetical protein